MLPNSELSRLKVPVAPVPIPMEVLAFCGCRRIVPVPKILPLREILSVVRVRLVNLEDEVPT